MNVNLLDSRVTWSILKKKQILLNTYGHLCRCKTWWPSPTPRWEKRWGIVVTCPTLLKTSSIITNDLGTSVGSASLVHFLVVVEVLIGEEKGYAGIHGVFEFVQQELRWNHTIILSDPYFPTVIINDVCPMILMHCISDSCSAMALYSVTNSLPQGSKSPHEYIITHDENWVK